MNLLFTNAVLFYFSLATFASGFLNGNARKVCRTTSSTLLAKGFGKSEEQRKKDSLKKSYSEKAVNPIKDLIDAESAMENFFDTKDEWKPLFRSVMVADADLPASSFIEDVDITDFEFSETSSPWKVLEAVPTEDYDRGIIADFLDNMQTALIDIPVDELTKEDENDLHFVEEGRRMLVCSRFHVIGGVEDGSMDSHERLFSTCWSEIMHLSQEDEADTGSLILCPGCSLDILRRFVDMNIQRPIQWLGLDGNFEIASMKRGSPAIRLIYKLSDIPTDIPKEPERP